MAWNCWTDTEPVARKDYNCDACDALLSVSCLNDYQGEDLAILKAAQADLWKIKAGSRYSKRKGIYDGSAQHFRARPEILELCWKYDIFEE